MGLGTHPEKKGAEFKITISVGGADPKSYLGEREPHLSFLRRLSPHSLSRHERVLAHRWNAMAKPR